MTGSFFSSTELQKSFTTG